MPSSLPSSSFPLSIHISPLPLLLQSQSLRTPTTCTTTAKRRRRRRRRKGPPKGREERNQPSCPFMSLFCSCPVSQKEKNPQLCKLFSFLIKQCLPHTKMEEMRRLVHFLRPIFPERCSEGVQSRTLPSLPPPPPPHRAIDLAFSGPSPSLPHRLESLLLLLLLLLPPLSFCHHHHKHTQHASRRRRRFQYEEEVNGNVGKGDIGR